jgi:DNA-binding transcriptional regulator YiaG
MFNVVPRKGRSMERQEPSLGGDEIRAYRESLGLTQVQLAKDLGVHPSTIQKWEANLVRPRGLARTALVRRLAARPEPEDLRRAPRILAELEQKLRDRMHHEFELRAAGEAREAHAVLRSLPERDRRVVERFLRELAVRSPADGFAGRLAARIGSTTGGNRVSRGLLDDLSPEDSAALEQHLRRAGE